MKIAAALPVPKPDHAEPLRMPDSDPDAFQRLWADLAGRAFAGAASEDQRGTGGEGADTGLAAAPPDAFPTEAASRASELAPAPTAFPPSGQMVVRAESGLVALRGLSPGPRALSDPGVPTLAPSVRPATAGSVPTGLPQDTPGGAVVDHGVLLLPPAPAAQAGSGGQDLVPLPGPTATGGDPAAVASSHPVSPAPAAPAESPSEPATVSSLAKPVAPYGAVPAPMTKTPHLQPDDSASGPAAMPTQDMQDHAPAPGRASRDTALKPGIEPALPDRAEAIVPGKDRPAPEMPALSMLQAGVPSQSAVPQENLPGKAGALAASLTALSPGPMVASTPAMVSTGSEVSGHEAGPPASAARPVQSPAAGPGATAQPRFPASPPLAGDVPPAIERLSFQPVETPPATPRPFPDWLAVSNAPDTAPDVNARPADIPDTWPLVLARVAGVHARRPPAEPQPAASWPAASGVARDLPGPARNPPASQGTVQDKVPPLPDRPGRSAALAFAVPVPAPMPVAARPDTMPLPSDGPDAATPFEHEPSVSPMAVVTDTSPLRSDDRRLPVPPEPPLARQMAEAMRAASGNRVDLTLMPEELGRLTISFRDDGEVLRVHIAADRPETLDLLRRHAPELAAELRAQGYDSPSFFFGRSGRQPSGYAMAGAVAEPEAPAADTAPPVLRPLSADSLGTLDLRL